MNEHSGEGLGTKLARSVLTILWYNSQCLGQQPANLCRVLLRPVEYQQIMNAEEPEM